MKITNDTRYFDFQPFEKYLTDKSKDDLKKAAEEHIKVMYDLTLGQFINCVEGKFDGLIEDVNNPTVLEVYWVNAFRDFAESFANTLKGFAIKQTAEEERASAGLPKQTFSENLLIFTRNYFALDSFREAELITMGEVLLAKKDMYVKELYQRRLHNEQMKKYKSKK